MKSDFDLQHQRDHLQSKIVVALERIAQAFRVLLWQESVENALTPIQIQILIFLHFHSEEKCKVSYLAREFNVSKATISETVKILESKKLIRKHEEELDTRSFTISLTSKGKGEADRMSLFSREIGRPIGRMPHGDQEDLLLNLLDIIRHLHQTGIITIQRMCLTCAHFEKKANGPSYCHLLQQPLKKADLRVDCPEHVLSEE